MTQKDVKSDRTQDPIVAISGRIELMMGENGVISESKLVPRLSWILGLSV
ncbi:MAG: hypothetical protein RID09_00780 [Coleofasciculus sp. G1-WW12-02]